MAGSRRRPSEKERLAAFDRCRDDLLAMLQAQCNRKPKTKSFDGDGTWCELRSIASTYLKLEARMEEQRMRPTDAARRLGLLGSALGTARSKLNQAWHADIRGGLFVEWCEANGNPDFTDPVIDAYERGFDKRVACLLAGLATLEQAAVRASKQSPQRRPGRPMGAGFQSHEVIVSLESVYRRSTGKRAGVGAGPFARFVEKFFEALQRSPGSVVDAIKAAKMRYANTWWGSEPLQMFND
jgi:hypothetical protein